ncbi:unnamed protein product [Diabrotica balteata]|uniref:Uncharacterized protein n=1 Tax=Diabrotica balteata TaxID=107213 RepID=A0A9N9SU67_DIABA|nr:unnamed protein product [Diabrotica balteata]
MLGVNCLTSTAIFLIFIPVISTISPLFLNQKLEISERHLLEEENAALVSYDNANYVVATDNDNNKPGTSLLRVDLSPERKDELQISDFVNDNDDDSIKDPNYESDSSSSSSSSSSTSSDSSSSSSSYSPDCNGFLSNSHNVSQVFDPSLDFQAVNTPAASIQVNPLAANLQGSGPEVPDTQLADSQPANTYPADTKIASPKKRGKK